MKISLIGATGQIGFALANALAATPHQLTVLVRDPHKLSFPPTVAVQAAPRFTAASFAAVLRDADLAIYGVGLPEQYTTDAQLFQRINVGLLQQFLTVLENSSVAKLVYISTFEVFAPQNGLIREDHPLTKKSGMTPYFQAMIAAYELVCTCAQRTGRSLTTIHPAAVYGGLATGDGLTSYIENLLAGSRLNPPAIIPSAFPIVHAESLARAIIAALAGEGAYIISDQISSLREIAATLRQLAGSRLPPTIPVWLAWQVTGILEAVARRTGKRPVMSRVQIKFLTQGWEPRADRAIGDLGWQPLPLRQGLAAYLATR